MKRFLTFCAGIFLFLPTMAHAQESIPYFHVTAKMGEGRTMHVHEEIRYDFGSDVRHGIERLLPTTYARNGATYKLRLKLDDVLRDGKIEPVAPSRISADLRLRIGQPSVSLSGAHVYDINYHTDRAYLFFPDHDELYWNVTGDEWLGNIEEATFRMKLLPSIDRTAVKTICYTGYRGSTESSCTVSMDHGDVFVKATRLLLPGEGLTVAVWLPPGSVPAPNFTDHVMMFIADNGSIFFPIVALIIMFGLWWKKGRDGRVGTLVPEYTPPEKLPAGVMLSVLQDETVSPMAVTATILDLARRGYLSLRFTEEKKIFGTKIHVTFLRSQQSIANTSLSEQALLTGMFEDGDEQTPEGLTKKKFWMTVAEFNKLVQQETEQLGIYEASPKTTRPAYMLVGALVGIGLYNVLTVSVFSTMCAVATGVIIAAFGYFMPKRNAKGMELLRRIEGFRWFLSVTEKDRMSFHQAPSRTPEQFFTLLPYAVIFKIEKEWAGQFASMTMPAPMWAEGSLRTWNSVGFARVISDMHHDAVRGMYANPSTAGRGGSGFSGGGSGGGFGGGGGRSW